MQKIMEKRLKAQNIFSEYPMLFQIENKASLPKWKRGFSVCLYKNLLNMLDSKDIRFLI